MSKNAGGRQRVEGATGRVLGNQQDEETVSTRRVWRRYSPRPTRLTSADRRSLNDILSSSVGAESGHHRVWLVGGRPGGDWNGFLSWAFDHDLPDSWQHGSHYLGDPNQPVLRFSDGRRDVELVRVSSWLGEGEYTPAQAADALRETQRLLQLHWRSSDVVLLSTPATTGRDLFLRSIPDGVAYPVLPDDLQTLIRSTSGQGRWQYLGEQHGDTIEGVHGYDMAFGYAGMIRELGVGPVVHDTLDRWEPYDRGRYRATVRIPDGWNHLGLLPVPAPGGGDWHYPDTPGETVTTWADGAELLLAQQQGWQIERIHERIVFTGKGDPLGTWGARLVAAREQAQSHADEDRASLVKAALRSVLLHSIGAFHGRGSPVTVVGSMADADANMPAYAAPTAAVHGDRVVWTEQRPARWAALAHPEWSAAVWARCRSRLMFHRPTGRGALTVPRDTILALRTDAVYLTQPRPWHDLGRVGTLRPVLHLEGPLPTPDSATAMLQLRDGAPSRTRAHDARVGEES